MESLFDILGPEHRHPDLAEAVRRLAGNDETERGEVFTRPEVVTAILDLAGYTPDRPLHRLRLLEPSFGDGDFLLPALDRLLQAYGNAGGTPESALTDLGSALCGVELHRATFEHTAARIRNHLTRWGLDPARADELAAAWLVCDDFLLTHLEGPSTSWWATHPTFARSAFPKRCSASTAGGTSPSMTGRISTFPSSSAASIS